MGKRITDEQLIRRLDKYAKEVSSGEKEFFETIIEAYYEGRDQYQRDSTELLGIGAYLANKRDSLSRE